LLSVAILQDALKIFSGLDTTIVLAYNPANRRPDTVYVKQQPTASQKDTMTRGREAPSSRFGFTIFWLHDESACYTGVSFFTVLFVVHHGAVCCGLQNAPAIVPNLQNAASSSDSSEKAVCQYKPSDFTWKVRSQL
jgi:hypothetical protein